MGQFRETVNEAPARERVRDLIRKACWLLDTEGLDEWLGTFAPEGRYEVIAFSTEISKHMCWWRATRTELQQLFKEIPNHVREFAKRAHLVMDISIDVSDDHAAALSRFAVFKTSQQGESQVYALGHYEDELSNASGEWKFVKRKVVLDTRMFDIFPHMIPL